VAGHRFQGKENMRKLTASGSAAVAAHPPLTYLNAPIAGAAGGK
jgi:hypothetical protein